MCRFKLQAQCVLTFGYSRKQTPPHKLCTAIFVVVVAADRAAVFNVPVAVSAHHAAFTVARVSVAAVAVGRVRGGASGGAAAVVAVAAGVANVAVSGVGRLADAARPLQALGVVG